MNSKASTTAELISTSEPQDDSWIPLQTPSIIIPLERFKDPYPYPGSATVHQRNTETPIPENQFKLTWNLQQGLLQVEVVESASSSAADLRREKTGIETEAKAFTGFTDAEREEFKSKVGIKSDILRNFYGLSARKRCLGDSGNILKVDNGMTKANHGPLRSNQVIKCGIGNLNNLKIGIGRRIVDGVIEDGKMNCYVATTKDKMEKREMGAPNLSIPISTSTSRSVVKRWSDSRRDHGLFGPSSGCTDNSIEIETEQNAQVRERESSESSSSSSDIFPSLLEHNSLKFGSENDADDDWNSVDDDELYETGMLPPAYPKKTLVLVSPMPSLAEEKCDLFCGCEEEKDADMIGDDDDFERAKKEVPKSAENKNSIETGGMFGVSKMLTSGSLDSAIMRFQMDDSTARYDDNVDKLLKSYSSDQSFQWTPPKENWEQKGVSSKGQLPKPNMQCSRCKKLEYVKCESLESTGVIRPFVCANCTEFKQSIFLALGVTASLPKPKRKVAAKRSSGTVSKRRKRK